MRKILELLVDRLRLEASTILISVDIVRYTYLLGTAIRMLMKCKIGETNLKLVQAHRYDTV
jgi:hypothetical protein